MSPPGRPKGEYRSAQHEGTPMSPPGRPKGEYRSAQHEGTPMSAPGRPERELLPLGGKARSAKGAPMSALPDRRRALRQHTKYTRKANTPCNIGH